MNNRFYRETGKFERLNGCAEKGGVVFLGSTYWAQIPVNELAQAFHIDMPIYNRSIENMLVADAEPMIRLVSELEPSRIFVGLGDADLECLDFDLQSFLAAYEWMLYTLHARCSGMICILSVVSENPKAAAVNEKLRRLAADTGCVFVDISMAEHGDQREIRAFEMAKQHFLRRTPRFEDVFLSLS